MLFVEVRQEGEAAECYGSEIEILLFFHVSFPGDGWASFLINLLDVDQPGVRAFVSFRAEECGRRVVVTRPSWRGEESMRMNESIEE